VESLAGINFRSAPQADRDLSLTTRVSPPDLRENTVKLTRPFSDGQRVRRSFHPATRSKPARSLFSLQVDPTSPAPRFVGLHDHPWSEAPEATPASRQRLNHPVDAPVPGDGVRYRQNAQRF
jgi:hypothetical protein